MAYEPATWRELWTVRGPRKGAVALRDIIVWGWAPRGARDGGIYNRRTTSGRTWGLTPSNSSLHAVGRGIDIFCSEQVGGEIAMQLTAQHEALGVCEWIHYAKRWTPETGTQGYSGRSPHFDHIHIGVTKAFADSAASLDALHSWCWHYIFEV